MLDYDEIHEQHEAIREAALERFIQFNSVLPRTRDVTTTEGFVSVLLAGLATAFHHHALCVADSLVLLALACASGERTEDDDDGDEGGNEDEDGDGDEGSGDGDGGMDTPSDVVEPFIDTTIEPDSSQAGGDHQTITDEPMVPRPDPSPRRRRRRTPTVPVEVAVASAPPPRNEPPLRHPIPSGNGPGDITYIVPSGTVYYLKSNGLFATDIASATR